MVIKQAFCVVALVAGSFTAAFAQHTNGSVRMSAATAKYLHGVKSAGDERIPGYVYKRINGELYVSALVKVGPVVDEAALRHAGVHVGTRAGKVWTAQIPANRVGELASVQGLQYVALDAPIRPFLDSARKQTRADSAQAGINLPYPVTGKNVVMGVIDAGFDFTHPTLYDTTHTIYRVQKVWLQKSTGTPPAGFSYGVEFAGAAAITGAGYDTAITSHGAHVAGIAAGSGYGSNTANRRFRGMAFESDLVCVGIMPVPDEWAAAGEADIIDGINYIYTYAASVGKPAVVNLSWGSTIGPHDGHSLFSEACDALTGAGKIFVCAAGNNGHDTVHLQKTFTATDTLVQTFATFSPYLDTDRQMTWVDAWGDTSKTFCVRVTLHNSIAGATDSTMKVCLDDAVHDFSLVGANGDTCFVIVATAITEYNGKPHAFITLHNKTHDDVCVAVTGNDGTVDMWEGYVYPPTGYYGSFRSLGYPWAVDGDVNMTVSDIGCTRSAITVGAYTSKPSFVSLSAGSLYYPGAVRGKIAPFSSLGPTSDYRVKPDITAPGFALASAISSYDTTYETTGSNYIGVVAAYPDATSGRTYRYAMLAGTSMASPAAAGIVAMMLQLDPTLTPDGVKTVINQTAITDVNTGVLPASGTNTWGHGKINAYRAVKALVQDNLVKNSNMDPMSCFLYPNPCRGTVNIAYTSTRKETIQVTVTDAAGRAVLSKPWVAQAGANNTILDLATLPTGLYFATITTGAGYMVMRVVAE